ncbi:MAG: ATP synthase F1 subunit gamma [Bacteroidota bacterium]
MSGQLKEVRERITSVKSTQQITKAMKMVSAAKLRKAQQAITQMRPYANKLNEMLTNILSNLDGDASTSFGQEREVNNALIVVVTSNRGLCGAFNSNVIKSAVRAIDERYSEIRKEGRLSILCIGRRGHDYFRKRYQDCTLVEDHVNLFDDLSFDNVVKVSNHLMESFSAETYDVIEVSYGRFKNAAMQFPETDRFLPVAKLEVEEDGKQLKADYIFEPDQISLLEHLVPSILQIKFQKYLLDTHASEHGARMTAMDKATENANELLNDLKISYNKARQEAITKELSEIVGGAAALEGS